MHILDKITDQITTIGLPLYAVTLTAVPRMDTPLLLMLHWHGFRRELVHGLPPLFSVLHPVPGSALQLNDRWTSLEKVESALLDAAWRLGAWDIAREEKRPCNDICASQQETMECMQAFGEHPQREEEPISLISEAPDRAALMHLGANVGYIRWQFRPVRGGVWQHVSEDDTLLPDGTRRPPCPVLPMAVSAKKGKAFRTVYKLGKVNRIIRL